MRAFGHTLVRPMARTVLTAQLVALVSIAGVLAALPSFADGAVTWPMAGQNLANTRTQPGEKKLSPATVGKLAVKWTFTTHG
jgi:polyvinyl alcohol dehydrogenase (cytochrome)